MIACKSRDFAKTIISSIGAQPRAVPINYRSEMAYLLAEVWIAEEAGGKGRRMTREVAGHGYFELRKIAAKKGGES